ncbi:MAG: tRNA dihydrouridine synthase DusB [Clostridia bacterium]|nr:tRNA dihydrouridine synthase DusB [Clostridia bacterium]
MKIGNIELKNPFVLAPMAGFSDASFRHIIGKAGAGLVVTEMVSARGLVYKSDNTLDLLKKGEELTAVQLFSNEPEIIADCVQMPELSPFPIVDINMGCPVPKVVSNGMGSALMREPKLASEVIRATVDKANRPVTVKFRLGWDDIVAVDFAKMCEDSGASAITVHGRTREQMYSGEANWDEIAKVKQAVKIPVFGNGDVDSVERAHRVIADFGVDGVAIGRGALGNPWLFQALSGEDFEEDRLKVVKWHYDLASKEYGKERCVPLMRKHLSWYLKHAGIRRSVRAEMNLVSEFEELIEKLELAFKS